MLKIECTYNFYFNVLQPEPFFVVFSLYDARAEKKISEDFYYDPNSETVRKMLPQHLLEANDTINSNSINGNVESSVPDLPNLDEKLISYSTQVCVFFVSV